MNEKEARMKVETLAEEVRQAEETRSKCEKHLRGKKKELAAAKDALIQAMSTKGR
jgi:hypothetical protein